MRVTHGDDVVGADPEPPHPLPTDQDAVGRILVDDLDSVADGDPGMHLGHQLVS
ncbi:MAG: hypothetical protein WBB78_03835 [Propionicimonas sp.]